MRREVKGGNVEPGVVRLDLAQKPPGTAGDIKQASGVGPDGPLVRERALQRDQCLTPHGGGPAAEQHLDLVVVPLGGSVAQVPVGLEMKFLPVISRIAVGRRFAQEALFDTAMPSLLNRGQIGEKIEGAPKFRQWVAELV